MGRGSGPQVRRSARSTAERPRDRGGFRLPVPPERRSAGDPALVEETAMPPPLTPGAPDPRPPQTVAVRLKVNGEEAALELDIRTSLLDALREHLGLTGSKKGCDHGQC